jgi:hypothetical protein
MSMSSLLVHRPGATALALARRDQITSVAQELPVSISGGRTADLTMGCPRPGLALCCAAACL